MKTKPVQDIEERAVILGRYILENKSTVRAAAKHFGVSKSTVHMVVANQKMHFCYFVEGYNLSRK